jgi:uncharacterized protein YyaL (SSP411 family)
MNHLQNQVSPYLLQHKHNPVEWYPWGEVALDKARNEDKPIILSIGYAACHWCHVMEHESFENQEVATLMNNHFICIKVDREERPDIDLIYMDSIHAMGLQGGWPLNVFLMPDQKPFYGGTYFPKNNWIQLLNSIQKAFQNHKIELQHSADGFASNMNSSDVGLYPIDLEELSPILPHVLELIQKGLDPVFGGTNKAPKFPIPSLGHLIEALPYKLINNSTLERLADLQLTKMALGGIFDQVGGGFSRYSVDSEWFCPHFEKMLYDNGQLLRLYALAYKRTSNSLYKEVIVQLIGFLNTELVAENGLYYASIDADSEGIEGLYYVWTFDELNNILPLEKYHQFYTAYSVNKNGNWEHGYNILFKKECNLNEDFYKELSILNKVRNLRIRPATDTKQILSWNAYVSLGLFEAAIVLDNADYLHAAKSHLEAMITDFFDEQTGLIFHQTQYAAQPIAAFLDDLAACGLACIKAYQTFGDKVYLNQVTIILKAIEQSHTRQNALYNFHSNFNDALIAPKFEIVDSVCPSSNSMLCELFLWFGVIESLPEYTIKGKNMLAAVLEQAQSNPIYFANWLRIHSQWIENPQAIIKYNASMVDASQLNDITANYIPIADLPHMFLVCIGDRCLEPCLDKKTLIEQLKSI